MLMLRNDRHPTWQTFLSGIELYRNGKQHKPWSSLKSTSLYGNWFYFSHRSRSKKTHVYIYIYTVRSMRGGACLQPLIFFSGVKSGRPRTVWG